jgi:hypothetical protein
MTLVRSLYRCINSYYSIELIRPAKTGKYSLVTDRLDQPSQENILLYQTDNSRPAKPGKYFPVLDRLYQPKKEILSNVRPSARPYLLQFQNPVRANAPPPPPPPVAPIAVMRGFTDQYLEILYKSRFRCETFTSGYTVKKRLAVFPSPAGMSLTKLSLARKN